MNGSFDGPVGPLAEETPRRQALPVIGAALAGLLGAFGLRDAQVKGRGKDKGRDQGKQQGHPGAEKKGKKPGLTGPLTITKRTGPQFSVNAGQNGGGNATCNPGEVAIGGGAFTFTLSDCNISSSFAEANTTDSWRIIVFCATDSTGAGVTPQVVCLAT
jgi:hypothetical protein